MLGRSQMESSHAEARMALTRMVTGYWLARALHVVAELGVADLLRDGPRTSGDLADACGAHEPTLYRLLRALANEGVFEQFEGRRFGLTPLALALRSDDPSSMRSMVRMYGAEGQYTAWADLLASVRTGEPAFARRFGMSVWEYRSSRRDLDAVFNEAMTSWTKEVANAVVSAYDFSGVQTVIDIGGGHGLLLASILRAYSNVTGVLLDLPRVIEGARPILEAAGVADRCQTLGQDFFQRIPDGGDAYVLAQVLHDWDDERCAAILKNCRQAMHPAAKLLVIEQVLPSDSRASFANWLDLHMLIMHGGRERTQSEYAALFNASGLQLSNVIPTESPATILEAIPAGVSTQAQ